MPYATAAPRMKIWRADTYCKREDEGRAVSATGYVQFFRFFFRIQGKIKKIAQYPVMLSRFRGRWPSSSVSEGFQEIKQYCAGSFSTAAGQRSRGRCSGALPPQGHLAQF